MLTDCINPELMYKSQNAKSCARKNLAEKILQKL